jgi:hypothetical protein
VGENIEAIQATLINPIIEIIARDFPRRITIATGPLEPVGGTVQIRLDLHAKVGMKISTGLPPGGHSGERPMNNEAGVRGLQVRESGDSSYSGQDNVKIEDAGE